MIESLPLITVFIPSYNMGETIEQAISSVLSQTYSNLEIIIIDDGSTDSTEEKCKLFLNGGQREDTRVQYLKTKNNGRAGAINIGAKSAKGEFYTVLDADDTLPEDSIKKRFEGFDSNVKSVYGNANYISSGSSKIRKSRQVNSVYQLLGALTTHVIGPTIMMRADVFTSIGGFDIKYLRAEDDAINLSLFNVGGMKYIDELV
ncbi:MAG: glycosyltransferase family A protein [archaeon]